MQNDNYHKPKRSINIPNEYYTTEN